MDFRITKHFLEISIINLDCVPKIRIFPLGHDCQGWSARSGRVQNGGPFPGLPTVQSEAWERGHRM